LYLCRERKRKKERVFVAKKKIGRKIKILSEEKRN